jgi:glucose-6-phosphate 1-epimerase
VHLTCGSLRDLGAFFWLRVFPAPKQSPRPPKQTDGRYLEKLQKGKRMSTINNKDSFKKEKLVSQDGASVEICLYGGHVTGWHPAGGPEQLFLSEKTIYKNGVPIRGGIPVCFPQFNNEGPIIKHGFARITQWKLGEVRSADAHTQAELLLEDTPETRQIWPFAFSAKLVVTIGGSTLRTELLVTNKDKNNFTFTGALHTYLRVSDISKVGIEKLHGQMYRDAVSRESNLVQAEEELAIKGEVDRIYINAPKEVIINEPDRKIKFRCDGFKDIVVWNPGLEKCKGITDMDPEDYQRMVCVEAALVNEPQEVPSGTTWYGMQELTVI